MANKLLFQAVGVILAIILYHRYSQTRPAGKLPPGPKPLPLLGNINDLPPKGIPEYQHWLKHMRSYGPLSSITVLGQTTVIFHDRQAAHELLERTAKKMSGRPRLVFGPKLCGFDRILINKQPDDESFRCHRRLMQTQFGSSSAVAGYHDVLEAEVKVLLLRIWRQPERTLEILKTVTGSIILRVTYGYAVDQEKKDPLLDIVGRMMEDLSVAFTALAWLVDLIPALQYLPSFLPGMGFKKTAEECKKTSLAVEDIPYAFTRRQMESSNSRPSYVSRLLQDSSRDGLGPEEKAANEDDIKCTACIIFGGGADTTSASLNAFVLAMTLNPEIQRKAQKEIDSLTGSTRLPSFEDRSQLPYIDAIVTETLRWLPVAPMGTAHMATEDVFYNGYLIPKGAQLVPSIWWFTHDPDVYRDPDSFDPDRYAARNEPDPRATVFGFGRRRCPGMYFAEANLFIIVAQMLAVFTIGKVVGEDGKEVEPEIRTTPGLISNVLGFPFTIKARNVELLRAVEAENPGVESDAGLVREEIDARMKA
ncbi:O-methylsterigmatocystin oxidoreductase [Ophiocordyceps camponoti-floridani]|uniref:O-methylsterigmatocystin oxidoreductase n=1 Tax=Ophiocordyceps camponoti-floridani TaxID=2030778 RepID=A0A8H4VFD9_9HYPO|nr:O-methylsterigmatocystin oxidoreductase [Ophiocordyceps camponoti-floridani]